MKKAEEKNVKLLLPVDIHESKEYSENSESKYVKADEIDEGYEGMDIGPETINLYAEILKTAKTIMWNGPLGVFEFNKFANGTNEIARILAKLDATVIIGGGDSAAAIEKAGVADKMSHISTGGGASLEYLEGRLLPGIECLQDK